MHRGTNSNTLYFEYVDGTQRVFPVFTNFFQNLDNQWIHITIVCDYTNKKLYAYRNGVQYGVTQNLTTPLFPLTNRVKYIGSYNTASYKITDGSLDEVRIYNRGLSAEEISAQYTSTKGKFGL
jgi:hypothetical protein